MHKTDFYKYDVVITNVLAQPNLVLMNAEMIKEITSAEKIMNLTKKMDVFEVFLSVFKKGLGNIEGK